MIGIIKTSMILNQKVDVLDIGKSMIAKATAGPCLMRVVGRLSHVAYN